jgi:hypothetical protein
MVYVLSDSGIWDKFDGFFVLDYMTQNDEDLLLDWISLLRGTASGSVIGEYRNGTYTDKLTGYINTGYNPSTDNTNMAANDVFVGIYLVDELHDNSYNIGCSDGTNGLLFYPKRSNGYFSWSWANTTTQASIENTSTVTGLCGFSQIDGDLIVFSGGEKIGESSVTPASLPNEDFYIFRSNINGSPADGILNRIALVMYGGGLTEDEFAILNRTIETYISDRQSPPDYYENDYIYYKREAFHVDCQRDDYRFGTDYDSIYYSLDGGENYSSLLFTDASEIEMSYIFSNGNVIFATHDKIYKASSSFLSYSEITVKDTDGSDYTPHTPANANFPGNYYRQLNAIKPAVINGEEMAVWINYGNLGDGANPTNIYYAKDNGDSVLIAYTFGQNPDYRDDGTYDGGTTGTLLGDASNDSICRHGHSVACDEDDSTFYVVTGDFDRTGKYENHWLKGVYSNTNYSWEWTHILSASNSTRYKSAGLEFYNDTIYFVSDATNGAAPELGVFKCHPDDIASTGDHIKLYSASSVLTDMAMSGNNLITTNLGAATNTIYVSSDLGETWNTVQLSDLSGGMKFNRIHSPNADGWFRMDMDAANYYNSYPVYIKIK